MKRPIFLIGPEEINLVVKRKNINWGCLILEFKTKEEIKNYLDSIGVYKRKYNGGFDLFIKTSKKTESSLKMRPEQEVRLANFLVSNTPNFNIDFFNDSYNIRVYATEIDYDVINNFNKENNKLRNIKSLQDELQKFDYLYSIRESQYFQINDKNRKGLFLVDKDLVPTDANIVESDKHINYLKSAASFNGTANSFEAAYREEMSKFNKISICEFKK